MGGGCLYLIRDGIQKGTYFPHETHTGALESVTNDSCKDCHKDAETAENMENRLVPTSKEVCESCHDKTDPIPDRVVLRMAPSVIDFSHQLHSDIACKDCHEKVITDEYLPLRQGIPQHEKCAECHEDIVPSTKEEMNVFKQTCETCHKTKIMPRNHYENWMKVHKIEAAGAYSAECATCHADNSNCTTCHAGGVFRPESHDLSWIQTHGIHVRNDIQNCQSCHADDDCQDCHRNRGVSGSSGYRQTYDLGQHPPGWNSDIPNTGNHHSMTARMQLDSCKTCHMPSDCRSCHFQRFPYGH